VGFRDFGGSGAPLGSNGHERPRPDDQRSIVHRTTVLTALAALALTSAAAAVASTGPDAQIARAALGPYTTAHTGVVVDAGVTAQAHLVSTPGGRIVLRVTAEGLAPGGSFAVHVHDGACTEYLGHHRYDAAAPASRDNEIWLDLDANAAGHAADQVQVASFDLEQPLSLVIHQHSNPDVGPGAGPPGPRIACGNLELDR
jgi:Cu/Zn superoxide dismutase